MQWYEKNNNLFLKIKSVVEKDFSALKIFVEKETVFIEGLYTVNGVNEIIDQFSIQISFPPNYPNSSPKFKETGGRFPRNIKRHIFNDGSTCLYAPDEEWKIFPDRTDIHHFINIVVTDFLLQQLYFDVHNKFYSERSHGAKGRLETYKELFGEPTSDRKAILGAISLLAGNLRSDKICPFCLKELKKCKHQIKFFNLQSKIEKYILLSAFKQISEMTEEELQE